MEKKIEISILCQIYGKLLTEKQFNFIDDYYNNDLSLSEIADNYGITRQAARDNIKKGENKLFEYEEKLGIMKTTLKNEKTIEDILMQINSMSFNVCFATLLIDCSKTDSSLYIGIIIDIATIQYTITF